METLLLLTDASGRILSRIYNPAYMAKLQVNVQDTVATASDVYISCSLANLFITLTGLLTSEGISELFGRGLAAYPFQISEL